MTAASTAERPPGARRVRFPVGDLRLWLGLALMVGSIVLGARLMAGDEDRVLVLQASRDLSAGTPLAAEGAVQAIAVPRAVAGDRYLAAGTDLAGARLSQPVRIGELVPAGSVSSRTPVDLRTVTVPVDPLHAPPGLLPGDRVDVWSSPRESDGAEPALVLSGASVHAVPGGDVGLGGEIGVVLAVPAADVGTLVAAARGGVVDLVAVPLTVERAS